MVNEIYTLTDKEGSAIEITYHQNGLELSRPLPPGTVFVLEPPIMTSENKKGEPYIAVLTCPDCGVPGFITEPQAYGHCDIFCGSRTCAAWFYLKDPDIIRRRLF